MSAGLRQTADTAAQILAHARDRVAAEWRQHAADMRRAAARMLPALQGTEQRAAAATAHRVRLEQELAAARAAETRADAERDRVTAAYLDRMAEADSIDRTVDDYMSETDPAGRTLTRRQTQTTSPDPLPVVEPEHPDEPAREHRPRHAAPAEPSHTRTGPLRALVGLVTGRTGGHPTVPPGLLVATGSPTVTQPHAGPADGSVQALAEIATPEGDTR